MGVDGQETRFTKFQPIFFSFLSALFNGNNWIVQPFFKKGNGKNWEKKHLKVIKVS